MGHQPVIRPGLEDSHGVSRRSSISREPTPTMNRAAEIQSLSHLDILPEAQYPHLECLLKNRANGSNSSRGHWIS